MTEPLPLAQEYRAAKAGSRRNNRILGDERGEGFNKKK